MSSDEAAGRAENGSQTHDEHDRGSRLPGFEARLRSRSRRRLCEPRPRSGCTSGEDALARGRGQGRPREGRRADEECLESAGQSAEQITDAARREAEERSARAKNESEKIVAGAKTKASEIVGRANAEAKETVTKARHEAAEHLQRTRDEVTALREEAEARLGELHADTESVRNDRGSSWTRSATLRRVSKR